MSATICPRCGSSEIRGGKQDIGNDTLYSFYCGRCHLYEDHLRSEPGFDAWRQRWNSGTLDRPILEDVLDERAPRTALFGYSYKRSLIFPPPPAMTSAGIPSRSRSAGATSSGSCSTTRQSPRASARSAQSASARSARQSRSHR